MSAPNPSATWWHGSPHYIERGQDVLPGCEVGHDRWGFDRARAVFVTTNHVTACDMGAPTAHDLTCGLMPSMWAPYVYEVEPIGMYATEDGGEGFVAPHAHVMSDERQCQRARILRVWGLVDEETRKYDLLEDRSRMKPEESPGQRQA